MARHYEHPPAPDQDGWSTTWGDPALQSLGRYLEAHGLSAEQAALTVEQIWLFYSYEALPMLRDRLPMGIAAKEVDAKVKLWFFLPADFRDNGAPAEASAAKLQERFEKDFAKPMASLLTLKLKFLKLKLLEQRTDQPNPDLHNGSVWFERLVRSQVAPNQLTYIGTFTDDLEVELMTVMEPSLVPLWLATANSAFGGLPPIECLRDAHDRQLRDMITRAKFNLLGA